MGNSSCCSVCSQEGQAAHEVASEGIHHNAGRYTKRQELAAIKIQSNFRGHTARKLTNNLKQTYVKSSNRTVSTSNETVRVTNLRFYILFRQNGKS